jgi:hypothetical protein
MAHRRRKVSTSGRKGYSEFERQLLWIVPSQRHDIPNVADVEHWHEDWNVAPRDSQVVMLIYFGVLPVCQYTVTFHCVHHLRLSTISKWQFSMVRPKLQVEAHIRASFFQRLFFVALQCIYVSQSMNQVFTWSFRGHTLHDRC